MFKEPLHDDHLWSNTHSYCTNECLNLRRLLAEYVQFLARTPRL